MNIEEKSLHFDNLLVYKTLQLKERTGKRVIF